MISKKHEEKDNFWIAYADLMAGLLLVFVMLIGAIVVKYVLTQSDLESKDRALKSFQEKVQELSSSLQNVEDDSSKLKALNLLFKDELEKLSLQADNMKKENDDLVQKNDDLVQKLALLKLSKEDEEKANALLKQQLLLLQNSKKEDDEAIKKLQSTLSQKEADFSLIMKDLNETKERIQSLSSSKDNVIAQIKSKLGNGVSIDSSGSLTLSSSIFFDKASSVLKESSKAELQKVLTKYFDILLNNPNIKENLDYIIIEGHTDSDGSYLSNLRLSQDRAYNVMEFINSFVKNDEVKKYLMASGRSYMDTIKDANGKENKDASRRIEIKFAISNKEVMQEIENFLNYEAS